MKPFKIRTTENTDVAILEPKLETENEIMIYKRQLIDSLSDKSDNPLSLDGLKFLTNNELIERYIQIDQGAARAKWHICWLLRQRFDSDKLFGQYVEDLNSTQTNCLGSQKNVWRSWRAGEFCDKYEIGELSEFNLSKSIVYELSAPANESVVEYVLSVIKNHSERMPINAVRRLIEQSKAVATQELDDATIVNGSLESDYEIKDVTPVLTNKQVLHDIVELVKTYNDVELIQEIIDELEKLLLH